MKLLIGIPHTGLFHSEVVHAILGLQVPAGAQVSFSLVGHSLVYDAREGLAKNTLEEYDAILFLDSDMVPAPDTIIRLLAHNVPIVSALCFKRTPPHSPCIFKKVTTTDAHFYEDYPKGLIEVAGAGMACTLIRKEVFEKVPQPWFFPVPIIGEDLSFCLRVRDAGHKIYCDTTLVCGHMATTPITEAHYQFRRANL